MKKIVLLFLIIILIIPTGCGKNSNSEGKSTSTLDGQLQEYILEKKPDLKIKDFEIVYSHIIKHGMIFLALFKSGTIKYEAFFCTQQKNAEKIDNVINWGYIKNDLSAAFTHNEMAGDLALKGENKATYAYLCGFINNKSIKSLNIEFDDGLLVNVLLGNKNVYSYARTDKFVSLKYINALDKDGNIIFTYPPYPPEKK